MLFLVFCIYFLYFWIYFFESFVSLMENCFTINAIIINIIRPMDSILNLECQDIYHYGFLCLYQLSFRTIRIDFPFLWRFGCLQYHLGSIFLICSIYRRSSTAILVRSRHRVLLLGLSGTHGFLWSVIPWSLLLSHLLHSEAPGWGQV